jgi:RNA polymerase-binding transcription factor DksA
MRKFTIEEIKNYIISQDSLGDVLYNLNEQKIEEANNPHCVNCGEPITVEMSWENEYCHDCRQMFLD